jgi:hypothetical protein
MANRLLKVPQVTFRAGVPAVPPTPAYCTYEPLYADYGAFAGAMRRAVQLAQGVAGANIGSSYFGVIGQDAQGKNIIGLKPVSFEDLGGMFFGPGSVAGLPRVFGYYQRCYPAVAGKPAIPPLTSYDAQTGWNSGGLSIGGFAGDGYAQFAVSPDAIGVIVGINVGPDTESPADCSHAFYTNRDNVSVFERGQVKYVVPGATAGQTLRVDRRAGVIAYFVDDEQVYQSLTPSDGFARIDASLYVAGDYVENPSVGALNAGAASTSVGVSAFIDTRLRAATSVGVSVTARGRAGSEYRSAATTTVGVSTTAAGAAGNNAQGVMQVGVVASARLAANTVVLRTPRMSVISASDTYAQVEAAYAAGYDVASIGGFPEILFAGAFTVTPPQHVFSYGASGGIGQVVAQVPTSDAISADYAYAQVEAVGPGRYFALSYEPVDAANAVFIDEVLFITDSMTPFVAVHATFSSVVSVGDALTIDLELIDGFEWLDALLLTSTVAELSDKTADFSDVLYVTDQNADSQAVRQVVTNTTTSAATTYSEFDFLSLHHTARYGSFAVRADGVYRVAHGSSISAMLDTGSSTFGGYAPKRLEAIYVGMRTDGQVIAVVRAEDESERTYRVVQRQDYMRVSPAKGESSKSWRLRLELTDAQDGDVDVIQFVVSEQARRWGR